MRKIQTKMAAWVGLVALVYGVPGVAPAAAQSGPKVRPRDLNCTAGQTVLFDGTDWVCDPPSRFVDNGNGTISDNQTGLVWEKKLAADGSQGGNCNAHLKPIGAFTV